MSLKDKMNAALKKANSVKKDKDLPEVPVNPRGVYKGPFSKMKAKKAIKRGDEDTTYAYKKGIGGREKIIKYEDSGKVYGNPNSTEKYPQNSPVFMSKKITSRSAEFKKKLGKMYEAGKPIE